ncbi:MAG: isocitrate lyase/PEP mutase family protein [Geminicoccaceae bacterium]
MSGNFSRLSFRDLHHRDGAFVIPNPWDVGSARILASMGFEALATTSAGLAFSLGLKDGGVTPEVMLDHCRDMVAATPLPVSADLEKGFGDQPDAVADTIAKAADAGLAGCSIEDFTGDPARPIYDFALAVERIAAASEAARVLDRDFVVTARSENFLHGRPNFDDTVRRLQAFERAGTDVLYAPGLRDLNQIRTVCESVSKPVNIVMGLPGAAFSVAELSAAGVKRISVGSALARLAYGGLIRAAKEMKEEGTFAFAEQAGSFAEIEAHF